jgi:hypothetical protein
LSIHRKKVTQKIAALLLCLVLAATIILCGMTCAKHILHRCNGGDCRICDMLLNKDNTCKLLFQALFASGIIATVCGLPLLYDHNISIAYAHTATLVRLKIRLNS